MPPTAENLDNWLLVLGFLICGISLLLIQLRRHQFRHATARDLTREQMSRLREQSRMKQSMDDLLIQLAELARDVNAQIDTKLAVLERTIADADEKIAALDERLGQSGNSRREVVAMQRIVDRAVGRESGPDRLGGSAGEGDGGEGVICEVEMPTEEAAVGEPESAAEEHSPQRERRHALDAALARVRARLGREQRSSAEAGESAADDDPLAEERKQVYGLRDSGMSVEAISSRVGLTAGEVQILLDLRSFAADAGEQDPAN